MVLDLDACFKVDSGWNRYCGFRPLHFITTGAIGVDGVPQSSPVRPLRRFAYDPAKKKVTLSRFQTRLPDDIEQMTSTITYYYQKSTVYRQTSVGARDGTRKLLLKE